MASAWETCAYFKTGLEFVPVLLRQRDHARDQGDTVAWRSSTGSSLELVKSLLDSDHPYSAGMEAA